jgi:hypothetical protein
MILLGYEMREAGFGLLSRIAAFGHRVRRMTPGPMLVRVLAAVAALAGLAVALPLEFTATPRFGLVVPVALGVGLFPRTRWVGTVSLLTIGAWLVNTLGFETEPVPLWRVAALAGALYVAHTSAGLAAVLPSDSIVGAGVLVRWAARTIAVLAASLGLGLTGLVVLGQLRAVQSIVGPIVGSFVAAGLAGLLAWHLRRRA